MSKDIPSAIIRKINFGEDNLVGTEETMDATAAAALLGTEAATISQYARTGELPGARIGKGWIFLKTDVVAFLKSRIDTDTAERRARHNALQVGAAVTVAGKKKRSRRTVLPVLPPTPKNGRAESP